MGIGRLSFGLKIAVHVQPPDIGVEPASAGGVFGVHAESVAALFEVVELDRTFGCVPAFDQTEVGAAEERIVGGQGDEQRRRIGWHVDGRQRAIDVSDKRRLGLIAVEGRGHGEHRSGGEADHADAVGIDVPLRGVGTDEGESCVGVGDLGREAGGHVCRCRARRWRGAGRCVCGSGRGGARGRWWTRHEGECFEVCGGLVEAVLEDEGGDAFVGQGTGDLPTLVFHRERAEAATGCDDHRGASCLRRVRKERREGGDGNVAGEHRAVLAVPRFRGGCVGQGAGAEFDGVRLGGDGDGSHLVGRGFAGGGWLAGAWLED